MNEEKSQNFCKHRLIICDVAVMATGKNRCLPGSKNPQRRVPKGI